MACDINKFNSNVSTIVSEFVTINPLMNDASLKYKKSKTLALLKETSTYYIELKWILVEHIIYEFPEDLNNILSTIDIHRI